MRLPTSSVESCCHWRFFATIRESIPPRPGISRELGTGGEGGVPTLGKVTPTHAFQACSFSHSDTSPGFRL